MLCIMRQELNLKLLHFKVAQYPAIHEIFTHINLTIKLCIYISVCCYMFDWM